MPVAVVAIERSVVVREIGNGDSGTACMEVVADGDPHGGLLVSVLAKCNAGFGRNFSEFSVAIVAVEIGRIRIVGDVKIGPFDYNLYSNNQAPNPNSINSMPLKTVGQSSVLVADVGKAVDAQAIQTNVVRVDGQPSVYLPILKQGGDTNTIAVLESEVCQ